MAANQEFIENKDSLIKWLEDGCKPRSQWRIGVEHEKLGYKITRQGLQVMPYEGKSGIRDILEKVAKIGDMIPMIDNNNIIGLRSQNNLGASITLEPGGQFELSGMPLKNIRQACEEITSHINLLRKINTEKDKFGFTPIGFNPKWTLGEIPVIPKSRYKIMKPYVKKAGKYGIDMMFRTSTVQVNLDFSSENDMRNKMYVSTKLQPIATALFCNSPIREGKITQYQCIRGACWLDIDKKRSGLLQIALDKTISFEKYVDYLIDIPMYFVITDGKYYDAKGQTFRDYIKNGLAVKKGVRAVMEDWDNHVSTIFPEVRLKKFIEMRGADAGDHEMLCALPAFWVGLLYDNNALDAALELADRLKVQDIINSRPAIMKDTLEVKIGNTKIADIAKELIDIATMGLKNRAKDEKISDESHFLMPLKEIVETRTTKAQGLISEFKDCDYDIDRLLLNHNILAD